MADDGEKDKFTLTAQLDGTVRIEIDGRLSDDGPKTTVTFTAGWEDVWMLSDGMGDIALQAARNAGVPWPRRLWLVLTG